MVKTNKQRLKELLRQWQTGKISGLEYSRRATKLTRAMPSLSQKLKSKLAKIDRKYNPRPAKVVSGGLPELGKGR